MDIGDLINLYRKQAGLTIDELAEKSGVPKGTINKIIGGVTKGPTLPNMKALARAMGKTLADFDDCPFSSNIESSLGERIRDAREKKGLRQSDLAKMIGVKSSGVISNWEKDINKPDADRIIKLCQTLDVSASYLLGYYGEKESPSTNLPTQDEKISEIIGLLQGLNDSQKDFLIALLETVAAKNLQNRPAVLASAGRTAPES